MPFTEFGDASLGEFYHDVGGAHIVDVAHKAGAYTVGVLHAASTVIMYLYAAVHIQSIGEYHLLGARVDAQLGILLYDLVYLLLFLATVHAQTAIHHRHALGEVIKEEVVAKAVVEIDTIVAIIDVREFLHHHIVALEYSTDNLLKGYDLMRERTQRFEIQLHGKPHIT